MEKAGKTAEREGRLHNVASECKSFIFRLFVKFLSVFFTFRFFLLKLCTSTLQFAYH